MPPEPPSDIRVFIHWDDQTVFAGEDIKCRITFRNVAPSPNQPTPRSASGPHDRYRPHPSPLATTGRVKSSSGLAPQSAGGRGHRTTLSLNVPINNTTRSRSTTLPWTPPQPPPQVPGHIHKRSLSIVSIGSTATADDHLPQTPHSSHGGPPRVQRPTRGHGRSSSLQISPRHGSIPGPQSATLPRRPGPEPSPVFNNNSFPPARNGFSRSGASTAPNTPGIPGPPTPRRRSPLQPMPDWKFPTSESPSSEAGETVTNGDYLSAVPGVASPLSQGPRAHLPMRTRDSIPVINEHHTSPAAARILSETSMGTGTPRSSGEFYSMSNNSSETLASEYVAHPAQNMRRPPHLRNLSVITQTKAPEMLMMGYAQIQGSFTLDGSLVSLAPFEPVKRKAVLGGQGGGVIGVETSKRSSLGFGWSSFGNSLSELLGSGEQSSIKEMRGAASTKSIPLLSTPQSVLFVDLQLAPAESKTYEYTFKLPKGLPPSHRGKAIKIVYNLVVGTQRPGSAKGQQVRTVEIPFRVLGSVNSYGEILGHDLLSPYIILRDQAKVNTLDKATERTPFHKKTKSTMRASSINEFLHYVDELLERPRNGGGLLSPTATAPSSRRPSVFGEEVSTAKDAIDLAIMRSNLSEQGQSSNRFEIARNGQRIGVIMLARPAYRLGEVVSMAIDFTGAEVPCYAVHAALETTERVDPSLALRSEASVHRVTRKVFGSSSESTLYARRIVFTPTIPINATPEFVTTGINLEWKIRVEFVVPSAKSSESGTNSPATPHHLLEEIARDERGGLVLVAVENLECESFEIAVPIRVYGAVCNGLERLERDEALDEGLAV